MLRSSRFCEAPVRSLEARFDVLLKFEVALTLLLPGITP